MCIHTHMYSRFVLSIHSTQYVCIHIVHCMYVAHECMYVCIRIARLSHTDHYSKDFEDFHSMEIHGRPVEKRTKTNTCTVQDIGHYCPHNICMYKYIRIFKSESPQRHPSVCSNTFSCPGNLAPNPNAGNSLSLWKQ